MRLSKGRVVSITAIGIGGLIAFLAFQTRKPTLSLNDGTILTLEQLDYGKRRPFRLNAWRERVQGVIDHLPGWLSRHLPDLHASTGSRQAGQLPVPGEDALYFWLTRRDRGRASMWIRGWTGRRFSTNMVVLSWLRDVEEPATRVQV